MRNKLINFKLAVQIIINQARELRAAFDPAKGTPFPDTTGNELEC